MKVAMFEKITQITGKNVGPTSIILAGVHGNERCGIDAFKKIIPTLKIEAGDVFFIYGNPKAIEVNQRFTEANLNRMFKNDDLLSDVEKNSYEYKRVQFLKTYLNQAGALLDIHASFTPNSKPFIICEANAKGIAEYLPVNMIVSGFDQVEPGGTDYYMNSIGKIGICLECGYLNDPKSAVIAKKSIISFLEARGHISNNSKISKQSYIKIYDLCFTKTNNFSLIKPFADFEEILSGQVIGTDGEEEIKTKKDSMILFAQNKNKVGEEAFLLGEKKNSLA
jgi:succinylglutamate desuccinylase